jgi:pimeloyl-ACP methyl ester carboxylesterase
MAKKNKVPFILRFIHWFFPKLEIIAPSLAHRYFIHIFYTPLHYKTPEKEIELLKTAKEFSLTYDGKQIQCYKWGTMGPKVLLVHGWAGRAGQFRSIIPALLAKGFQPIAFDGPAHGRSQGKQTSLAEFADVIQKIIDVEGEIRGIIAHSFGGVAALYGVANGLPVKKLITISSPTLANQVLGNFLRALNGSPSTGEAFRAYLIKTYGKTFEEFSSLHLVQHLPAPIDLLLIQDKNDPEVSVENSSELKKVYPAAQIHLTEGLGHTRILRDEGVISLCLDFLGS